MDFEQLLVKDNSVPLMDNFVSIYHREASSEKKKKKKKRKKSEKKNLKFFSLLSSSKCPPGHYSNGSVGNGAPIARVAIKPLWRWPGEYVALKQCTYFMLILICLDLCVSWAHILIYICQNMSHYHYLHTWCTAIAVLKFCLLAYSYELLINFSASMSDS